MTSSQPHRKRIIHYDGQRHARSLTFSCYQRLPFLNKDRTRQWMLTAIELARQKHSLEIWAYVIMPEHVHLLLWLHNDELKIQHVLSTIKQSVSKRALVWLRKHDPAYLDRLSGSFHFWQDGPGYDLNLYSPRAVWNDIDYIHLNPVRRKLVSKANQWQWSSMAAHLREPNPLLAIDFQSLPEDPR